MFRKREKEGGLKRRREGKSVRNRMFRTILLVAPSEGYHE